MKSTIIAPAFLLISCLLFGISGGNPERIDGFGLVTILPVTLYASFALLGISFVLAVRGLSLRRNILQVSLVYLFLSAAFLAVIPFISERTPRFRTTYNNFGFVDDLLRTNHIHPSKLWYHNWPGFSYLFASLMRVCGLGEPSAIMILFPVLIVLGYMVTMVILLRRKMPTAAAIAIPICIFVFTNWVGQDYLSPQAIGTFMFTLFLALLLVHGEESRVTQIFFLVSYPAIAMTHALTALVILSVLALFFLLYRRATLGTMVLYGGVIFLLWNAFGARAYAETHFLEYIEQMMRLEIILAATAARFTGSWAHQLVVWTRVLFSTAVFALGALGMLLTRKHWDWKWDGALLATIIGICGVSPFLVYGGELMMRVYSLSLPFVAIFAARALSTRRGSYFLLIFLVIALPVNLVARYGNEQHDYIRPSEMAAADFMYGTIPGGIVFGGSPWPAFRPGIYTPIEIIPEEPGQMMALPATSNTYAIIGLNERIRGSLMGEDLEGAIDWIDENGFDRVMATRNLEMYLYPVKKRA